MQPSELAARIVAAGRAAWPAVVLADDAVLARVTADPDAQLDAQYDGDLYLALGLALGNAAALRAFEDVLVPHVTSGLRRMRLATSTADEVVQALRVELIVHGKIADYAARGPLGGWLRVTATRKAWKLERRADREATLDDLLLEQWPSATPDPASAHIRSRYTAELKAAIGGAFADLEPRQRNLLRQHLFDDLTIDDLARMYRVHRATCARWLADARADLGRGTRKRLVATLGVSGEELDSVLRFLDSDIELSISRLLVSR